MRRCGVADHRQHAGDLPVFVVRGGCGAAAAVTVARKGACRKKTSYKLHHQAPSLTSPIHSVVLLSKAGLPSCWSLPCCAMVVVVAVGRSWVCSEPKAWEGSA